MTFIISDVVGDDLASIGSGPTAPDPTTFTQCLDILARYDLMEKVPAPVLERLKGGVDGRVSETPKPGDPLFDGAQHLILASNRQSMEAAKARGQELGYETEVFAYDMEGSTHDKAKAFTARLAKLSGRRVALLAGGETTLVVKGSGKGGRNQEFALVAAREMEGREGIFLLAAGTDGTDGPTDAAGAFADGTTFGRARSKSLDPIAFLDNNDAYNLFGPLGDLIKTGPTGTNVMDLVIGLTD
jgi:hydroxypyruvate reductase